MGRFYNFLNENSEFSVQLFSTYIGNRSESFRKNAYKPFMKLVNSLMKDCKGKWNGNSYEFKTEEAYKQGKHIMEELHQKWNELLQEFPEHRKDISSDVANSYFEHNKISKNPKVK